MSSYRGNSERCRHCQLTYGKFRTGLCYRDVWLMFYTPSEAPSDEWKYKTRGVVLGKWFEIKQELWQQHLIDCARLARKRKQRKLKRAGKRRKRGTNVSDFQD
jgi:hypothetical protein